LLYFVHCHFIQSVSGEGCLSPLTVLGEITYVPLIGVPLPALPTKAEPA